MDRAVGRPQRRTVDDSIPRLLYVRAANAVDHTQSLARLKPTWRTDVRAFSDGWLVLAGRGMYLNQTMAAGMEGRLKAEELDVLIEASTALGVVPTFEVSSATLPLNVDRLLDRGFAHITTADISFLTRPTATISIDAPDHITVHPTKSQADLEVWQVTSAAGWGHTSTDARWASDAFAAAAHALDNEHMVIALDADDGRPLGAASMTVNEGLAMLGGMSTIPAERRRGVQAALVRHRLVEARRLGCDLALSTAATGSASERNLKRYGFSLKTVIQRFEYQTQP